MPLNINSHFAHIFTSVVLTPTLGYRWFKKNAGWLEEWKDLPLKKIRERRTIDYMPKPCAPPKTLSAAFLPERLYAYHATFSLSFQLISKL